MPSLDRERDGTIDGNFRILPGSEYRNTYQGRCGFTRSGQGDFSVGLGANGADAGQGFHGGYSGAYVITDGLWNLSRFGRIGLLCGNGACKRCCGGQSRSNMY